MRATIADEQHMTPSVIPPWRTLAPPTEPFAAPTRMTVFRLTPEQRETLLHAWARATDRTRAERLFLPAAEVVLVEPLYEGTTAAQVTEALAQRPTRLLSIGVPRRFIHGYGSPDEHDRALGLDVTSIRERILAFL